MKTLALTVVVAFFVCCWFVFRGQASDSSSNNLTGSFTRHNKSKVDNHASRSVTGKGRNTSERQFGSESDSLSILDSFLKTFEKVTSDPTLSRRSRKEAQVALINEYVSKVGLDFALAHLDEFAGPGEHRNIFITDLFEHAPESQADLWVKVSQFKGEERRWAFNGLLQAIEMKGLDSGILENFSDLSLEEVTDFSYTLAGLVRSGRISLLEDGVNLLERAYPENKVGDDGLASFLSQISSARMNEVLAFSLEHLDDRPEVRNQVIKNCLKIGLERSLNGGMDDALSILRKHPEKVDLSVLRESMTYFLDKNSSEGASWFLEATSEMSNPERDQVQAAFVTNLSKKSDFEDAWSMADKIHDQDLKQDVSGVVWNAERQVVASAARADPRGTLQKLIDPSSAHQEFWIKEAFEQWVSTDAKSARSWFDEKSGTLSGSQMEHIARVYASEALKGGDIDLAREWVGQIKDVKYSEPLVEKIETASTNQ